MIFFNIKNLYIYYVKGLVKIIKMYKFAKSGKLAIIPWMYKECEKAPYPSPMSMKNSKTAEHKYDTTVPQNKGYLKEIG